MTHARTVLVVVFTMMHIFGDLVSAQESNGDRLWELARQRFEPREPFEWTALRKICMAAASGELAEFGSELPPETNEPDPGRVVRAKWIEWICTVPEALMLVHRKGVRLKGAQVLGQVDLEEANVQKQIAFIKCRFNEELLLKNAKLRSLNFKSSACESITADGVQVDGDLSMENSFIAAGMVSLQDAKISGSIVATGSSFKNLGGIAIAADRLAVGGSVFLNGGFSAKGQVRFPVASIGKNLDCKKGNFHHEKNAAFFADGLVIGGNIFLNDGYLANGEVRLLRARIGGNLVCTDGVFCKPGGDALSADRVSVGGSIYLNNKFSSNGKVSLVGVEIKGDLLCAGGAFESVNNYALSADRADVGGGVFLDYGFSAKGGVRMFGAKIRGNLSCTGGAFENPGQGEYALITNGMIVNDVLFNSLLVNGVLLNGGFSAKGEIRMLGTDIKGDLICTRGTFENRRGLVLAASGLTVGGSVLLNDSFYADGAINIIDASINNALVCSGAKFNNPDKVALYANRIEVGGGVFMNKEFCSNGQLRFRTADIAGSFVLDGKVQSSVDMSYASVGVLHDNRSEWPDTILLDGFEYDRLHTDSVYTAGERVELICRRPDGTVFQPQPYTQLASVYTAMGHDKEAVNVMIAREGDRWEHLERSGRASAWDYVWFTLLGRSIGYGYRPGNAAWLMLALGALGSALFWTGRSYGLFRPTDRGARSARRSAILTRSRVEVFPPVYAFDAMTPIISLGQLKQWEPDPTFGRRYLGLHSGCWLRAYLWLHIAMGWLFTTLLVIALSGVLREV